LGKEDLVQDNVDGKQSEGKPSEGKQNDRIIDLKSGNLYQPDRQQVYLYLDSKDGGTAGAATQGRVHYRDKKSGFCAQPLSPSDQDSTDKFGQTVRGFADYDFYRNNWVLQFLYAAFVPELYVKTGDVDHVDLSPSKPTASCEKWTQETCEAVVPKLEVMSATPCSRFCKGAAAKQTFRIPIDPGVRHLYFKWMVSMVHKQAMLEYLEFLYFCHRPLEKLKESCRIVFNATFEGIQNGMISFRVPNAGDHSDFHVGTSIIVVPYEVEYLQEKKEEIGKPIREASGVIRFLRGTVKEIGHSEGEFKRFGISVTNPFPEHFLKRYKTFSFQESSFDSSPTESQVLFQTLMEDKNTKLRTLLLNETPLREHQTVDPKVRKILDWMNTVRSTSPALTGGAIDRNKLDVVSEAISADTLYMIQGPPGTGKTFSIVLIALYYLVFTNKNVKIATFTNNAAKRILDELRSDKTINFVNEIFSHLKKGGHDIPADDYHSFAKTSIKWAGKLNKEIDPLFLLDATELATAIEQGERAYEEKCWDMKNKIRLLVGTAQSLFTNPLAMHGWRAEETVTIIDEASQLTEPKTLLGLVHSEKYILVGDEKQLSPVVPDREEIPLFPCEKDAPEEETSKNSTALETRLSTDPFWEPLRTIQLKNFNESLFERFLRLYANVPGHHGQLTMVYRGPIELYEFSNREYYGGTLESFRQSTPSEQRVEFHDVPLESNVPRSSRQHAWYIRDKIVSRYENKDKISIVTLFNAQVHELRQVLSDIDIRTVDRMQGHENDIVIFDIAASTKLLQHAKGLAEVDGKLIAKKLNVALTRAKEKLIIVADRKVLESDKDKIDGKVNDLGSFKKLLLFLDEIKRRET
jgi:hypothetical protein